MAIIKCTECGGTVSDKAEICPHCGAPVKEMLEAIEKEKKEAEAQKEDETPQKTEEKAPQSKKVWIIILAILVAAAAGFGIYQMNRDKEPPAFSGIKEGQAIDIDCGSAFNLNNYLKENLKVTDNKSGNIENYTISADEKVYNAEKGDVYTGDVSECKVTVSASDEAENTADLHFSLKINPIHITKDNKEIKLYDGEYATINMESFKHGYLEGEKQYQVKMTFKNNWDEDVEIFFRSSYTYINDVNIDAYYTAYNSVKPGKEGHAVCEIYEKDIPDSVGDFDVIETAVGILDSKADKCIFQIPILIDKDVFDEV